MRCPGCGESGTQVVDSRPLERDRTQRRRRRCRAQLCGMLFTTYERAPLPLPQQLRRRRVAAGLGLREWAKTIGLSVVAASELERGVRTPDNWAVIFAQLPPPADGDQAGGGS